MIASIAPARDHPRQLRRLREAFRIIVAGRSASWTLAEAAYVALLPAALFFAYQVSPINQVGGQYLPPWVNIDPWVYTGYIHNFEDLIARYGLTYYSVRFGLIFPHLVLAKAFGPFAGYLAFCYLLYLLAGIPFYLLFRKRYSVAAAVFAYALLVSSLWLARTVLWTHPDAAAVPYTLAAVSLLLLDPPRRAFTCVAAGFLFALAANCNIFTLSISGLSGVAYMVLHYGNLKRRLARDVAWMIAGFALVFALGAIGYVYCCGTPNFIGPTWTMVVWAFSNSGEYQRTLFDDIWHFSLRVPAAGAGSGAGAQRPGRRQAGSDFHRGHRLLPRGRRLCLVAAVFVALVDSRALLLLCVSPPPFFICAALIAVRLCRTAGAQTGRQWLFVSTATVLLLPLLHAYRVVDFSMIALPAYLALMGIVLATIALGRWATLAAPVGAILFSAAMHLHWNAPYFSGTWGGAMRNEREVPAHRLALSLMDQMPKFVNDGRQILFWYPYKDPLIRSLQSTYLWGYSKLNSNDDSISGMPQVTAKELERLKTSGGPWLVLIDRSIEGVKAGIQALDRHGIALGNERQDQLCSGPVCITVLIATVSSYGIPAAGSVDGLLQQREHLLFGMEGPSLLAGLQLNGYGKLWRLRNYLSARWPEIVPPRKLVEAMPDGRLLFRSTTAQDHLATEFIRPHDRS